MDTQQLLAEVEDLLRTLPNKPTIHHDLPENFAWFGRAGALVRRWSATKGSIFDLTYTAFAGAMGNSSADSFLHQMMMILYEMRADLMLSVRGPLTAAIGQGMVFDYFDELRKIIQLAQQDVFFVDPYLDADFVSRYLPHVRNGASIRLLTREKLSTLMPAVRAFSQQTQAQIEVRKAPQFHDRYLFVDGRECYQSGASFKDGARTAPTTLTQILDAFGPVQRTYEDLWSKGTVQT